MSASDCELRFSKSFAFSDSLLNEPLMWRQARGLAERTSELPN
jgi:hypothetical protein